MLLPRTLLSRPLARRCYSSAAAAPLKLAVIGSGPSGFYAASRVLQLLPANTPAGANIQVDMYERLPTPYGLARYGVAPDHPEVKNCQHKFDEMEADPRFSFFGNVSVGSELDSKPVTTASHLPHYTYPHALHVPLSDLAPHYNAVLFTYGASLSNPLSWVPGSSASEHPLPGVVPALAFVSWYNGHPAYADLKVDLSKTETVAVVGQGNVALDVARILLKDIDTLRDTDIPQSVIDVLAQSAVKRVSAVGRRGPGQVAFSTKEFREMVNLPGVAYPGVDTTLMAPAQAAAKGDRMRTRMLALMDKRVQADTGKEFSLSFLRSPHAFLPGADGRVARVEWEINELDFALAPGSDKPVATARGTGEIVAADADMVVESVGYRSEPLLSNAGAWVMPFDGKRGRIAQSAGRVVGADGLAVPGAYAAGWAARGPVGVIASTMQDAYILVDTLLADMEAEKDTPRSGDAPLRAQPEGGRPDAVERGLKEGKVVDLRAWHKIDKAERERGKGKRVEREKFARVEDMLAVL